VIITSADIENMERLPRVQLATSLPGAKPVCLVGTKSLNGITNLAPFSSITHLGSNPMLIGMITRPATVERNTLNNIIDTKSWTLNHVHEGIMKKAHQCSARYPVDTSEFKAVGLTEYFHTTVTAPFVEESQVKYALELEDILDIKANGTKLVIGRVVLINIANSELLDKDGGIDLIQSGSLASTALDTYFSLNKTAQLDYAKP